MRLLPTITAFLSTPAKGGTNEIAHSPQHRDHLIDAGLDNSNCPPQAPGASKRGAGAIPLCIVVVIIALGITLAAESANRTLRRENAELHAQRMSVATEVRPCAPGWWCMVAVGLDGAEQLVSLGRVAEYTPPAP